MFQTSSLTDAQKAIIGQWVDAGSDLADIQKKVNEEFQIGITYMETRFLIIDLDLEIKVDAVEEKGFVADVVQPQSGVDVFLDEDPIAGMMISGLITFSDGEKGFWYVDESGRPGLDMDKRDYQPSSDDIAEFQTKLQEMILDRQQRT